MFRFIHCADIHLDSPLEGLDRYDGAPVEQIRGASREALRNLVDLSLEEQVAFVVVAGDVFDGEWKDYNTGLYFSAQMSRLRQARIPVFLVRGNHDADSQISARLSLPENVHSLSSDRPETVVLDELGVAIHGQSFAQREVRDDLSRGFPEPEGGLFNVGVLHTSADGRRGHGSYAPCTMNGLISKGYDYWALGHVHTREVLHEDPWVVFPGNVQGRHIRETGAKGCSLVTVDGREVRAVEHRELDVVRWSLLQVDVTGAEEVGEILPRIRGAIRDELERANGRFLAVRIRGEGACGAHKAICADPWRYTEEVRAQANDVGAGRVWIEKVEFKTSPSVSIDELIGRDDAVGGLVRSLDETISSDGELQALRDELSDLRFKLPYEISSGEDPLDLESEDGLREILDDVRALLVSRLLRTGGAS